MVLVYDMTTKALHHTEDNTMLPALPAGTLEEKKTVLALDNLNFVSIPYEMGTYIWDYDLRFDENGAFRGLQPKVV